MRVKVCGMTQAGQVLRLAEMGVNYAGFIFYAQSPRYALRQLSPAEVRKITTIGKVGVFVNAPEVDVLRMTDACDLQMVQLHGDETPEYCARISGYVAVVKAFRVSGEVSISELTAPYQDVCQMFLFDTLGTTYGGTGHKFDWSVLSQKIVDKPYFLSGGIDETDAFQLREWASGPLAGDFFAMDINSRFERSPGIKDLDKIARFLRDLSAAG